MCAARMAQEWIIFCMPHGLSVDFCIEFARSPSIACAVFRMDLYISIQMLQMYATRIGRILIFWTFNLFLPGALGAAPLLRSVTFARSWCISTTPAYTVVTPPLCTRAGALAALTILRADILRLASREIIALLLSRREWNRIDLRFVTGRRWRRLARVVLDLQSQRIFHTGCGVQLWRHLNRHNFYNGGSIGFGSCVDKPHI